MARRRAPGGVVCSSDLRERKIIAFWLTERRVLAAEHVIIWDWGDQLEELVRARSYLE